MNLITAAEVVTYAFNDKNFLSGKILDSHIKVAQHGFLRPALGEDFYDALTTDIPSGINATLVNNYLKPALAWYVRYVVLPEIMVHASNTGVQLINPQGTQAASDKQAGTLREQAKANADILLALAKRYIEANIASFPLYLSPDENRRSNVLCGVIFPRRQAKKVTPAVTETTGVLGWIVNLITDLRTKYGFPDESLLFCNENNCLYQYDETSEAVDDGDNVLRPIMTGAGRWLKTKEFELVHL